MLIKLRAVLLLAAGVVLAQALGSMIPLAGMAVVACLGGEQSARRA